MCSVNDVVMVLVEIAGPMVEQSQRGLVSTRGWLCLFMCQCHVVVLQIDNM